VRFGTQRKSLLKRKFGKANSKFVHSSLVDHEFHAVMGQTQERTQRLITIAVAVMHSALASHVNMSGPFQICLLQA